MAALGFPDRKKIIKIIVRFLQNDQYISGQVLAVTGGEDTKISKLKNYAKTMNDPVNRRAQRDAILIELENLVLYNIYELCELPPDRQAVGCKQIFKNKYDEKDSVIVYKTRLIAQDFF